MIQFLRDIFLPTHFRQYFVFPTDFLGITVHNNMLHGVKITASGRSQKIKEVFTKSLQEPVVLGKYYQLILGIEDANIIFKTLTIPFLDPQKINEILPFEIESLIPFSKEEAAITFIQTKIHAEDNSSDIIVAVVKKSILQESLIPLKNNNIAPDKIVAQSFLLWSIYSTANTINDGVHVIMYVEQESISVLVFLDTQLKLIRVLPYGLYTFINQLSKELNESFDSILQNFTQKQPSLASSADIQYRSIFKKLKTDLSFTMQPFLNTKKQAISLSIVHAQHELPFFTSLITQELGYTLIPISLEQILEKLHIADNNRLINQNNALSLYAALPSPDLSHVNFVDPQITTTHKKLFIKQIITATLIIITTIVLLFLSYKNSTRVLQTEIKESEQEIIQVLRTRFDVPPEEKTVDDVIEYAESEAKNQEKTWLAFSKEARASVLQYLLELTEKINKDALGFVLERLNFEQNKIIMKAEVRDYEALKILERELRQSPLFTYVEPQDNPRFTMTINLLPLGEQE